MTTYPLDIWTINEQIAVGYTVDQMCPRGHGVRVAVDLAGLKAAGYGDRPVRSLGLKCNFCESRMVFTIHPTPRFAQSVTESRGPALPIQRRDLDQL